MAPPGFPQFSDGNVEIRLEDSNEKFILHSYVLALHSNWFKSSLKDCWNTATMIDEKHRWFYELRFDKGSDFGMLARKETHDAATSSETELFDVCNPPGALEEGHDTWENRSRAVLAHESMLRSLYHISPLFSNEDFYEDGEHSVLDLQKVYDAYGCEAAGKLPIENYLRKVHDDVEECCTYKPLSMLKLAIKVKSDWIFKEAFTNILGRSDRFFNQVLPELGDLNIRSFFEKCRSKFKEKLHLCEKELFCIQPSNDKFSRIALDFFRQWLSEQLKKGKGSGLSPGYANRYHVINKGFSYKSSDWEQLVRKHAEKTGTQANDYPNIDVELRKIVIAAANALRPILKDETRYQDTAEDMSHALTFMTVYDEDLPWEQEL